MSIIPSVRRIASRTLDLFYPASCVNCGAGGSWWCNRCRSRVELVTQDPCPRCMGFHPQQASAHCHGTFQFCGIATTGYYHSKPLRKLITEVKYNGVTATGQDLERYLSYVLNTRTRSFPWAQESSLFIQPMPLAPERERERGFNQAAWIADRFKRTWLQDIPMLDVLVRHGSVTAQATLQDKLLRTSNVQGDFIALTPVRGSMILVDDVVTTGSTASEAARALIRAGAYNVYLLTLAIGK
ncbi:hypothetical protein GF380_04360 [Candidatus Uhrbacteria bacterium]|nr:hypothetical protein [Candidatus Uhrbacteria bacterium]MBD3284297.1 hypothetical protein [Candidatus Uhrbacteria bacterium]